MMTLIVGADRSALRLWLGDKENWQILSVREPVQQRNDLQLIDSFLSAHRAAWSTLGALVIIQVPHSRTTVRVLATALATVAWYQNRPLICLSIRDLESVGLDEMLAQIHPSAPVYSPKALSDIT